MEMNVNEKRKELLRALSENEFSADFHIFVTETLQDAGAFGEDFETAEENDKTEE